ncbi:hypothetical protein HHK36_015288 [Tetracentron sinense]|uniref:YLP motif-containing protein 1 n=1 Tax=Tetracentron sinense TaxID=13715 RepID=A0A835DCN7_TETSI|nr:hypothetical protein HHK36_015288 [Tetracentron sinense]
MMPVSGNPEDVYGNSQTWHRNQHIERDLLRQFPPPSQMAGSAVVSSDGFQSPYSFHGNNGFMRDELVESDRSNKRMKVGEMGSSSFTHTPPPFHDDYHLNSSRILSEDERRLNLIRDHGGQSKSLINMGANNLYDPGFGSVDRKGPDFHPEPVFSPPSYFTREEVYDDKKEFHRGELGLAFGHQHMQTNRNGLQYDEGHAFFRNKEGGSNEKYHINNHQQFQQKDSMPAKEPEYTHITNWKVTSGLNALHHEQRSYSVPTENCATNTQLPQAYTMQHPVRNKHDLHFRGQQSDVRQSFEVKLPSLEEIHVSVGPKNLLVVQQFSASNMNKQGSLLPLVTGNRMVPTMLGQGQASRAFGIQPPLLPPSPPPPLPEDPPGPPQSDLQATFSPPRTSFSLYPVPATSSTTVPLSHPGSVVQPLAQSYFHNRPHFHASTAIVMEGSQALHQMPSKQLIEGGKNFPVKHLSSDKPKVVDASRLFRQPHRAIRPGHIVIILRGLPGSGKSYLAKMLRDLEVENGGDAPRIHSMDDYFMTEVEKVEESEVSKSSSLVRGKKANMKKVIEYCFEPEMEEAYRSSMLKAFKKTLEEGIFTFIIVDDRNLRVADFAQFWAIAKRSGYEVYLLEATYKDPVGCAARNVHGFTLDEIQKMAGQWEEAPPLYLQLDIKSLFHGDDLNECGIQEVDMDTEDGSCEGLSGLQDGNSQKTIEPPVGDYELDDQFYAEIDDPTEEVKELGRSKWSDNLDEDDFEKTEDANWKSNALSGLMQAYGKGNRSVHWGDQVGKTGFSIGAEKKLNVMSLVIGHGAGYNLKSNPLLEEDSAGATEIRGESKKRSIFKEQLRAECESFRAVLDRRRQRIGGFDVEDE